MAASASSRWYFREEKIKDSPSRRHGITPDKEESYRQQAANFIQDMGQRLQVTQLCINTAIVYMQRFYMFHSFTRFHRNSIAAAALFLAAKVEEQPRKLEHVIKVSYICLHRDQPQLDAKSEQYLEQAQELVCNENILLQTLGFDVAIDHPHTHVVKCCQLVKASKELAQTSYFMATNSLHLTTMCLRYTPTIVACVCIHLACKWSNYAIPQSAQGKGWFWYVDPTATQEMLEKLTQEFLEIFDKCPSRLKKKIMQSHDATKEEEERRARDNTQGSQYKIDFGVMPGGKQASQTNQQSTRPNAQLGQQRPSGVKQEPGSRPQPHPPQKGAPPRGHPQYPPGHPSQPQQPPAHAVPPGQQPPPPQGGRKPGPTQQNQYRPGVTARHETKPPKPQDQRPRTHPTGHPMQPDVKPRQPDPSRPPQQHRDHSASREGSGQRDPNRAPPPSYPGVKQQSTNSSNSRPPHPAKQPPPYPGHKPPSSRPQPAPPAQAKPEHRKPTSKPPSAKMRSLFDINESPEKVKPNHPSFDKVPPHLDMNPPAQSYQPMHPGMSPISDKDLSRASSLEPGELLDTPTPSFSHQQPYFSSNASHTQGPPSPPTLLSPNKPNSSSSLGTMSIMSPMPSLDSLLGFPEKTEPVDVKKDPDPPSRLQQTLFDPEYSDIKPKQDTLDVKPKLETVDYKQYNDGKPKLEPMSDLKYAKPEPISPNKHSKHRSRSDQAKTENTLASLLANPVSDLSTFPSHLQPKLGLQNTSNMLDPMVYGQPGAQQSLSHSQHGLHGQQQVPPQNQQYPPPVKTTPKQSRSDRSREKESGSKKRKSSERSGSGSEEKKTKSSLFSPSPEKLKSPGFGLLSPMKDERRQDNGEGRTRTASTSSSNAEPFVNIQKLESIAPECQTFKNSMGPASIVLPDGQEEQQQEEQLPPQELQQTHVSRPDHKSSHHHQDKSRKSGSGEKSSHHRSSSSSHRSSSEQKRSHSQHHPAQVQHTQPPPEHPQQPPLPPPTTETPAPPQLEKTVSPEKPPQPSPVKEKGGTVVAASGTEEAIRHKEKEHKEKRSKHHKKEKKSKSHKDDKERKDKKDKHHEHSKEGKDEHRSSKHKHKKSKSKDKDKDKEREKSRVSASVVDETGGSDTPQLKIKLKTTPSVSPRVEPAQTTSSTPSQPNPSIPKIKIKFGGSEIGQVVSGSEGKAERHHKSSSGSSHKKRERSSSSTKLDVPAAKMARAMGTRTEPEAKFLEEHFSTEKRKSSKEKSSKPKL